MSLSRLNEKIFVGSRYGPFSLVYLSFGSLTGLKIHRLPLDVAPLMCKIAKLDSVKRFPLETSQRYW